MNQAIAPIITPEELGIDAELCQDIRYNKLMEQLEPFMIIFKDCEIDSYTDEEELKEALVEFIELGEGYNIAYVFSGFTKMDMDYDIIVNLKVAEEGDPISG